MSKRRERRLAARLKGQRAPAVYRLRRPVLSVDDLDELLRRARESGVQVVGLEVCNDPRCLEEHGGA